MRRIILYGMTPERFNGVLAQNISENVNYSGEKREDRRNPVPPFYDPNESLPSQKKRG